MPVAPCLCYCIWIPYPELNLWAERECFDSSQIGRQQRTERKLRKGLQTHRHWGAPDLHPTPFIGFGGRWLVGVASTSDRSSPELGRI